MQKNTKTVNMNGRLEGLDIARFIAFVGMVIVNFKTAMMTELHESSSSWLTIFSGAFEGRAAATFVVLAGLGLGLSSNHTTHEKTVAITMKRALFLLLLGLVNAIIFEADILHYYAFYFLFGMLFLKVANHTLWVSIFALTLGFAIAILFFDYDKGWHWETLSYIDFWQPEGMLRNLLFNGWHPVLPWLAFFLFGIYLSRLNLHNRRTQTGLVVIGILTAVLIEALSNYMITTYGFTDPEGAVFLFSTKPIPPMPFYMLAGMAVAAFTIGVCLLGENFFRRIGILSSLAPAGRQTLTLYIAHIIVGMSILEGFGYLSRPQSIETAMLSAFVFSVSAAIYAWTWAHFFKRGPIESAMRKLAG